MTARPMHQTRRDLPAVPPPIRCTLRSFSLLQAPHHTGVLAGQRLGGVTRARLGKHMEEGPVGIGQYEHPLLAEVNLDTVDRLLTALAILLAQDAHHFAFVLPWAVHLRANEVIR